MKRIVLILITVFLGFQPDYTAFAKQRQFEDIFIEIGYTAIDDALSAAELHFNKEIPLPYRLPRVAFTHQVGRFIDLEGDINDSLEVEFLDQHNSANHYKIDIRPLKNKIEFQGRENLTEYTLKNGEKAIYVVDRHFIFFVVENSDWQYMFGIDKRLSDKVTPEIFVEIADSITME
ncbi:hypothetical protein FZC79_09050 [Rossellomorea vietnamensis]|uniref:Carbon monoxide dehydrogenase n=1 Tax=Rossellomorea vietnamensis TaxID=218284 RepID=A0A5D4KEM9_9BACI|nr:hypothetical protein [Rossellomorea vietnamensis]TYR75761.1 hypothetical protein FZC79_09050 [Rossellomorea vietnamensis]